jgi:TetR/AcrR family transcriptional repressor of nem operon
MGRPKQFDPDAAIDTAMDVFWRKGYAGTTPADLTEALGIGKGSLYNAFGSKHALFEQALRRYRDGQEAAMVEFLGGAEPVKDRVRNALRTLATMDLADPDRRGCLAVNTAAELGDTDEIAADLVRRMLDRTEQAFRDVIDEGQRSGEIEPGRDPAELASLLLNTVVGMRLLARVSTGPERLDRVIDAAVDAL